MGKHVRPSKTAVVTGTATAGLVLAGAAAGVTPAVAAPAAPPPKPADLQALIVRSAPPPPVQRYHVKSGDTLSGIAQRFCGSAAKWRQLFSANKGRIKNPNLIYPGELVRLACAAVARAVTPAAPDPAPSVTVTGAQGVIGSQALRAIRNLVRERIDEGQDFSGTGPLYPVAPGTIASTAPSGWPGSSYILEKLDAPVDGHGWVYYAEDITPTVHPGEHVDAGTVLGQVYHGGTGIEIGFGTAFPGVAAASGHYTDGVPTPEGLQMEKLLAGAPPHAPASQLPSLADSLSRMGYDGKAMAAAASYLRAHGYSSAATAGVLGCIAGESGGSPESVGSGGGGLIGWTPLPGGLVTGSPARDLQAQLARLIAYDNANGNVAALNAQPAARDAAAYYSANFERPAVAGSDIRYDVVDAVFAALSA